MLKIVFQKGNGLKKHLEKFWWQKKRNLIAFPSPYWFCKEFGFDKTDARDSL